MKILASVKNRFPAGDGKVNYEIEVVGGTGFKTDGIFVEVTLGNSDQQINTAIANAAVAYVNNPANSAGLGTVTANDVVVER